MCLRNEDLIVFRPDVLFLDLAQELVVKLKVFLVVARNWPFGLIFDLLFGPLLEFLLHSENYSLGLLVTLG